VETIIYDMKFKITTEQHLKLKIKTIA